MIRIKSILICYFSVVDHNSNTIILKTYKEDIQISLEISTKFFFKFLPLRILSYISSNSSIIDIVLATKSPTQSQNTKNRQNFKGKFNRLNVSSGTNRKRRFARAHSDSVHGSFARHQVLHQEIYIHVWRLVNISLEWCVTMNTCLLNSICIEKTNTMIGLQNSTNKSK